jgi:ATP adenylyltransferase
VLDQIWNGWRAEYVAGAATAATGEAGDGRSVFSRLLESGLDDLELNIIHRAKLCFAILNAFPYSPGHVLVLPYRQTPALEDLDQAETTELWSTVRDAVCAIKGAYRPDGLNVGLNLGRAAGGSIGEHLHVHVVPRWVGDSNFMTSIANARTIPEALDQTAERLREHWPTPTAPRSG